MANYTERPLLCSFCNSDMAYMYMPGATAVGITYDGGVVMASERRISYGNFVVSKTTKKTFKITDFVGACCAGMVADMQVLAMQMRSEERRVGRECRYRWSRDDLKKKKEKMESDGED